MSQARPDVKAYCLRPAQRVRDAICCIDRQDAKVALVVDEAGRLLDTITDGDIRRAILAGLAVDAPVGELQAHKIKTSNPHPITAPVGTDRAALLLMMQERAVRQIPLLDDDRRVVDLVTMQDLVPTEILPLQAVVMAGGFGTRLRPLTNDVPKVMLPVGDRPLLEVIVGQLREAGIHRVHVTTHYKADVIERHFGDGERFGVKLQYVREDQPLGTAGSLALLEASAEPLLVMNGDVMTRIDFRALLDFHHDHRADMTVGVYQRDIQIPYGVVDIQGVMITGIAEKPTMQPFINAGIYLLSPHVRQFIPNGQSYDMPALITRLLAEGGRVVGFPIREYWMDIGQVDNFEQAKQDAAQGAF